MLGLKVEDLDWAEVGGRIRRLRKQRRLSQKDLAEPLISASFLSLIESGARRPSDRALGHIAQGLDVEVGELLTGRSPQTEVEIELTLQAARESLRTSELELAERLGQDARGRAAELRNTRLEARCIELLGSIAQRRSDHEKALELYESAEAAMAGEPPHLRFEAVAGAARCHRALGDRRFAVHLLESYLLELEREGLPDPIARMRTFSVLVTCYSDLGLAGRAAAAAEKAQALAPRVSDPEQLACMNANVAQSLFEQGRFADALSALKLAEHAYLSLGWEVDAARAQINRGIVQIEKGELDDARRNLTDAVMILRHADHPSEAAKAIEVLGRLERLSGDLGEAERLLHEAEQMLEGGDLLDRAFTARELALCVKDRDRPEGERGYIRAIDLYRLAGAPNEVASTYKLLGDLQRDAGEIEKGAESYRAGIEAIESGVGDGLS